MGNTANTSHPPHTVNTVSPASPLSAILQTAGPVQGNDTVQDEQDDDVHDVHNVEVVPAVAGTTTLRRWPRKKALAVVFALQGIAPDGIAAALGVRLARVVAFLDEPVVKGVVAKCQQYWLGRIQRGEFGAIPMAKHAAEHMMGVLIETAKSRAGNPNTRRQAALDVLALAGHVAVKKAEVLNVNELIDQMAAHELETFITSGKWPDRLREKAALLSINGKSALVPSSAHAE